MKSFSLCFFLFFISLTFSQGLSKPDIVLPESVLGEVDMVSIQGSVKEWKTRNLPTSINFIENSIAFNDQITYVTKIDRDGKFSISFPKVYGQDIYVYYNENLYTLFVMPGDRITMNYDSENSDHPFEFMGDNAMTNYNMVDYSNEQRKIRTMDYFMNQDTHILKDSCYVYKEYEKREAIKNKDLLDTFLSKNETSDNFKLWAENELKYRLTDNLMRYRWLHFGGSKNSKIVELPDDYFDFIKEYPLNLDQEIVSSTFQGYCNELKKMLIDKMYGDEMMNPETIIEKLEENNIKADPKIKDYIKSLKAGGKPNAENDKLWDAFSSKHRKNIQEMLDKIPLDKQKEYIEKYNKPELLELRLTSELYKAIENLDTVQLATVMPKKLSLIKRDSFRKLLSKKYQDFLAETRKPFDFSEAVLNNKNLSSGDSLLVNITNKHKGKVIYVDFWATWCSPCREEMAHAKKIKDSLKGKEVAYVYLCGQSPETNWKKLIDDLEIKGDHYFVDKNAWQELKDKFGVSGIPHYLLIDKNGVVVDKNADRPSSGDKIVNDILKLL